MTLKQKVYNCYNNLLEEKIKTLRNRIEDLSQDAQNDAKGSAGDKHETALAMMHLEQEKLSKQLKEVIAQKNILESINDTVINTNVGLGSLVYTDKFIFFISIAMPKITLDNNDIVALSLDSPLGIAMKGKTSKEEFAFNNMKYEILKIE
ncbi:MULTISPECIES: hypothetical protein [Flavobacterium]|uniref:3-oxoacyl-ACP synthase n=1 Tax=Flavobacterium jumunjinense TaxID=998845 RepID=A0ABV5GI36_9FLAO|nr:MULTISPECIES: hypothetical protein [Flavobacterium]